MDTGRSFSYNVRRLEQRLNEVGSEKDAYEKDINTYAKENKVLKEQISHLRSSLNNADSKAVKTLKEIQDLHNKKTELLEDEHKRSLIEKHNINSNLRESIRSLKQDMEKYKLLDKENLSTKTKSDARVVSLRDKVNDLEMKISEKEQKLSLAKTEEKKKQSQQQVRISVLEDQLRTIRNDKKLQSDELVQFNKLQHLDLEKIHKQIRNMQIKLKLATYQNKNEAKSSKHEDELKSRDKQIRVLSKDLQEKSFEYTQLSEQTRQLESKNHSIKKQKQDQLLLKDDEILQLKAKLRDKDGELCSLSNKIASLEKNDDRIFTKHSAHVERLQNEMEQFQSDNNLKNEKLRKYKREMELLQSESRANESQQRVALSAAEKKLSNLRNENRQKDEEIVRMSSKLANFETETESQNFKEKIHTQALEEKTRRLEKELKLKSQELCNTKSQLLNQQMEAESMTSQKNTLMTTLKERASKLEAENQKKEEQLCKYKREMELLQSESRTNESQQRVALSAAEKKLSNLRNENRQKDEEIVRMTSKLANFETETESQNFKEKIHTQALEEKTRRLEKELKLKSQELCNTKSQLLDQQIESESMTSQKNTLMTTLKERASKLESENQKKEEQLCKVSTKLAHSELEVGSVSSASRVRVRTLEEKLAKIQDGINLKDDRIFKLESDLSDKNDEIHSLKHDIGRWDSEKKRQESQVKTREVRLENKLEENVNLIRNLQSEKRQLEDKLHKLKDELTKTSCSDQELLELRTEFSDIGIGLREANSKVIKLKEELALKLVNEQNLQCEVNLLTSTNQRLQTDLEIANGLKKNLASSLEDLSEKLKESEKNRRMLEEKSSSVNSKLTRVETKQNSTIEKQKIEIVELNNCLSDLQTQADFVKRENSELRVKCEALEVDNSLRSTIESQLNTYKKQVNEMQFKNQQLLSQQNDASREHMEIQRQFENKEREYNVQTAEKNELCKTNDLLKESCMLLEQQVESLETFNDDLIQKQNALTSEKDEALKKCSELRIELASSKHQMRAELSSLDQCNNDQIAELKVELRNEMNQLHEISEQHRDLELKYKNLELHAAALQRKLNAEKGGRDRSSNELKRIHADREILQQSLKRAEENLHVEIDRCDFLEREKTQMMNRVDTEKLEFSHELVRLNCQGAQQTKLIDFLQSRVEELEPNDKKKKKKKTTLYQAPLQYRELRDLLDEEKSSNIKLQEQVNTLRSELQSTNSKVKRLKHGMDVPLSPGSIAAISAIVKSPATTVTAEGAVSPKGGKLRSKPRMQHNIPHRLSSWVCHRATRCSVCLATIHFGHSAFRCSQCAVACHSKCKQSITNTCGLPGGLFQHFREAPKPSNFSPITVFKGSNSDQLHGRLKVLCGDDTWVIRSVRICSGHLRIAPQTGKSPSKISDKDDVIDLKQGAYVHTDLNQSELPNTAKQDLSYTFKIQSGSSNSCWPARSVYFLAAGFAEKHMWVDKLESIIAEHSQSKKTDGNAKIFGNEILTMLNDEKLEMNCSLPISNKSILFGCDEGLFHLSPSTSSASCKADMKRVEGFMSVYQLTALNKSTTLAIEGSKHKLVSLSSSSIVSNSSTAIHSVDDLEGCHLFSVGHAEGLPYLCVATATSIIILKYNEKLKKFCKKKEIATSEPCTCMVFTACSVIIGTNTFYEADLTEFKIDEFLEENAVSQYGDENNFPVSILKIKEQEGRQEFLLCFHEFGVFVDGFGRQSRSGRIMWSRMPLSFEFRSPYLIIVQFNSIEIILLNVEGSSSADNCKLDRAYLSFPKARFLGSAITEGAIYLSSSEGSRTSVFCCKGNMKANHVEPKASSSKRHYAALSSSLDSLSSPTTKRSTIFSDLSCVSSLKSSTRFLSQSDQSLESDTSKWTTTVESDVSGVTAMRTSESDIISSSNEESSYSDSISVPEQPRIHWRPAKTPPAKPTRKGKGATSYGHISSTQV